MATAVLIMKAGGLRVNATEARSAAGPQPPAQSLVPWGGVQPPRRRLREPGARAPPNHGVKMPVETFMGGGICAMTGRRTCDAAVARRASTRAHSVAVITTVALSTRSSYAITRSIDGLSRLKMLLAIDALMYNNVLTMAAMVTWRRRSLMETAAKVRRPPKGAMSPAVLGPVL